MHVSALLFNERLHVDNENAEDFEVVFLIDPTGWVECERNELIYVVPIRRCQI